MSPNFAAVPEDILSMVVGRVFQHAAWIFVVLISYPSYGIAHAAHAKQDTETPGPHKIPTSQTDPSELVPILRTHEELVKTVRVRYHVSYSGGLVGGNRDEADLSWIQSSGEHLADFTRRYWKRDSVIDMEKPQDPQRPPRGWNLVVAHNHGGYQQYSAFESNQPASRDRRILSNNTGVTNDDGTFAKTTEEEHPTRFMIQNCWLGFQEGARPLSYQLAKAIETGTASVEAEPVKLDGRETIKVNLQIPPTLDADVFLDPARGYNMVHADIRLLGPNNFLFAQIHDVTLSSSTPTVWLPTNATYSAHPDGQGKLTVHKQFLMEYTKVNDQIDGSEFVIEYPPGTHIVDHTTGDRLRIPTTGEEVRATAQEIYANPPPEAFVGLKRETSRAATSWTIAALFATFGFLFVAFGVYWRRRKARSSIERTCLMLFTSLLLCCDSSVSFADQEQQHVVNVGGECFKGKPAGERNQRHRSGQLRRRSAESGGHGARRNGPAHFGFAPQAARWNPAGPRSRLA